MEPDNDQEREIEISFDYVESATMRGDDAGAFIFYFNVKNLSSKRAKLFVSTAAYTTALDEEIDQDVWLSGIGNGVAGFFVTASAFKKIGCVYYTRKLPKLFDGDKIRLSGRPDKGCNNYHFVFHCVDAPNNKYELLSSSVEPIHAEESKFEITHLVERLELLEDKLGVRFEGLYVVCTKRTSETPADYVVEANFDVVGMGATLERSFSPRLNAYNAEGQLLNTATSFIHNGNFVGIESCQVELICDMAPVRLRLFPSR